jgi:hypothetical protein
MATKEGARRLGAIANALMTLSLLTLVFWFKASVILFVASWALYGTAWVIDGFSTTNGRTATE